MKTSYLSLFLLLIFSCNEHKKSPEEHSENTPEQHLTFDQRLDKEIRAYLEMDPKEKYNIQIYKAYINPDKVEDAIISINRENFMIDRYTKEGKIAKVAEIGFIARYNYIMYYDGARDEFLSPISIPSSCNIPLQISFARITSPNQQDIIVSYRAKDSGWKDYYTVLRDKQIHKFFQWETYVRAMKTDKDVKLHYIDSTLGIFPRDIIIYKSDFDHMPASEKELYTFDNSTSKKEQFEARFFYDPKIGKMRLSKSRQ